LRFQGEHRIIVRHGTLLDFFEELDQWPSTFRTSAPGTDSRLLKHMIKKSLSRQINKLHLALDDEQYDRHELQILVKRMRYLTDAFSELSPLSKSATKSLKAVQAALGARHDHFQWRLKAQSEHDLAPLAPR
jgi:CHAD domain-containing protein